MIKTFTPSELMAQWRLARHLEPLRAGLSVTYDGADTEAIDALELQKWWEQTLDTVPDQWLKFTDFTPWATLQQRPGVPGAVLTTPPNKPLRRVKAVMLEGWNACATVVSPGHPLHAIQLNPLTASGPNSPVAVSVEAHTLILFPPSSLTLASLQAVDEEDYTFDTRCLHTMTQFPP